MLSELEEIFDFLNERSFDPTFATFMLNKIKETLIGYFENLSPKYPDIHICVALTDQILPIESLVRENTKYSILFCCMKSKDTKPICLDSFILKNKGEYITGYCTLKIVDYQ